MNPNAMESFTLPTESFDRSLLPESAREVGSDTFNAAVARFFEAQFRDLGVEGRVVVSPQTIQVAWARAGADPIEVGIDRLRRGQLKEGCQWLEMLRVRLPDSERLLENLGIGLSESGQYDRAIECLGRLLELFPKNQQGRVALGVALGRTGDLDGAARELVRVLSDNPGNPWARKNLGGILFRQGNFSDAVVHLEIAVRSAPADGQAWLVLGETLLSMGEVSRARDSLRKARDLTQGMLQARATSLLDRTLDASFSRDADGLRVEVVDGLIWAIHTLNGIADGARRQRVVLDAALLGQSGLDLTDPAPVHAFGDCVAGPLSRLQVACLIHAGVQGLAPGSSTGLDWEPEYRRAMEMVQRG